MTKMGLWCRAPDPFEGGSGARRPARTGLEAALPAAPQYRYELAHSIARARAPVNPPSVLCPLRCQIPTTQRPIPTQLPTPNFQLPKLPKAELGVLGVGSFGSFGSCGLGVSWELRSCGVAELRSCGVDSDSKPAPGLPEGRPGAASYRTIGVVMSAWISAAD